uniref:Uncharacterized protein n=1 Tax=Triticum urartu TaxID=4572 RepID=A0A8R7RB28_TRIUA
MTVLDIFVCILAFMPTGWGLLLIAQAIKPVVEMVGLWGVGEGPRPGLRDPDGAPAVHAHRVPRVVPLRVRVPDQDALQPGVQQRPADLPYPRRPQEGPSHPEQGVGRKKIQS